MEEAEEKDPEAAPKRSNALSALFLSFAADVASLFPLSLSQLEKWEKKLTTLSPLSLSLSLSLSLPLSPTSPPPLSPSLPQKTTGPHGRRRPEEEPEHLWGHHQRRGAPREAGSSSFFFPFNFSSLVVFERKIFFSHSLFSFALASNYYHFTLPFSPPLRDAQRYLAHSRWGISSSKRGPRCRRAAAAETPPPPMGRRQLR